MAADPTSPSPPATTLWSCYAPVALRPHPTLAGARRQVRCPPVTGLQRDLDPQPLARGGELALVALAGAGLLVAVAALVGVGVAGALFGGGWIWPTGTETATAGLRGLLDGQPGAGLPPDQAVRLPGPLAVYGCIAMAELLTLTVATTIAVTGWRYHRPGDARRGMATRQQARRVLGRSRLRAVRTILRPDLHPPGGRGPRQADSTGAADAGAPR